MIDPTMVISSAVGVVLANLLVVLIPALLIVHEIRQYVRAVDENTESVKEHTQAYATGVDKALKAYQATQTKPRKSVEQFTLSLRIRAGKRMMMGQRDPHEANSNSKKAYG